MSAVSVAFGVMHSMATGAAVAGGGFNPLGGFVAGEQGAWFDPSDITTMYQDNLGVTAAALEQPVGLILDKAGGGGPGPDLVTNGGFADATGWTAGTGWTIGAGVASAAGPTADGLRDSQAAYITGQTYEVTFDKTGGAIVTVYVRGSAVPFSTAASGTLTARIVAGSSGTRGVEFYLNGVGSVDNVSARLVTPRTGLVRGAERITNGTFDTDTTGWGASNSTLAAVAGKLQVTSTGTATSARATQTIAATVGNLYEVTFNARKVNGTGSVVGAFVSTGGAGNSVYSNSSNEAPRRFMFVATLSSVLLVWEIAAAGGVIGEVAEFDSISVREVAGNHAYQATLGNRPVLSARKNLLTKSEQLDDATWGKSGCTITPNAVGTLDKIVEDGTTATHFITSGGIAPTDITHVTVSFKVRAAERSICRISFSNAAIWSGGTAPVADFNLGTGALGSVVGGTATMTALGGGDYRITFSVATVASGATAARLFLSNTPGTVSYTGDGVSGLYAGEAQLEVGLTATRYQRVNTTGDYDSVGFPLFLRFDGVNHWLRTNAFASAINHPYTVQLAGLCEASTAATQCFMDGITDTNRGRIGLDIGATLMSAYQGAFLGGSVMAYGQYQNVTATANTPASTIRQQGVQTASGDAGNHTLTGLTIGGDRTAAPIAKLKGNLYQLVVRGALSTAPQIANGERYNAAKMQVAA